MALKPLNQYLEEIKMGTAGKIWEGVQGATYTDYLLLYVAKALEELTKPRATANGGNGDGITALGSSLEMIDPRHTDWHYHTETQINKTISAGTTYRLFQTTEEIYGELLVVSVETNNPNVRLFIKPYDHYGDYLQVDNTAQELWDLGRITPASGFAMDLIRYDSVTSYYTWEFRPPLPGMPFHEKLEIWVKNEDTSDATMYQSIVSFIKLD